MRWLAAGIVAAIGLGAVGVARLAAAPNTSPASLTPITPCRLTDTRPAPLQRGPRSTPLAAAETYVLTAWGTNGDCTIPATATALSMNVTVVNGTAASFLTVFPADVTKPEASSSNWTAGQAATPNAVTSPLSADGKLAIYNLAGSVDVIVDVVGYYRPLPTTAAAPVRLDAVLQVPSGPTSFSPIGASAGGTDRLVAWGADTACTLSGTATLNGTITAGGFSVRFRLLDANGVVVGNGTYVGFNSGTPSGTKLAFVPLAIDAGERMYLTGLVQVGLTFAANTTVTTNIRCQP